MARGWESKSVEESQADRGNPDETPQYLTREQRARARRRHSLELSRAQLREQLGATTAAVRRAALESALAQLDDDIAALAD